MKTVFHESLDAFLTHALPTLTCHEAENAFVFGAALCGTTWATVDDEDDVQLAAAMGDGRLALSRGSVGAARQLARDLLTANTSVACVMGEPAAVDAFASVWPPPRWSSVIGYGVFVADRVKSSDLPAGGCLLVPPKDLDSVKPLIAGSFAESAGTVENIAAYTIGLIEQKRLWAWYTFDKTPVSIATVGSPTPNGMQIAHVFTPAPWRGRGYATACVASLTQVLLDAGCKFVYLLTDLARVGADGIYRRIGYRPVGELKQLWFDRQ